MINAGGAGERLDGGRGPGYETEIIFDQKLGQERENPIYSKQGNLKTQIHWQIDHSIPLSLIHKTCLEFNFNTRKVYANHYLNLRPMWSDENLSKADTIADYILQDEKLFKNLIEEIFIQVMKKRQLNEIINYLKKFGAINKNTQLTFSL